MSVPGALRRAAPASAIAALAVAASPAPASASVTIGQLAPPGVTVSCVGSTFDQFQRSVSAGTSYVVEAMPPARNLMISSWSHQATPVADAPVLTMKVFRQAADPSTFMVVGHDGPRTLMPDALNTFSTHLPVQPGDLLGLNSAKPAATACNFESAGNTGTIMSDPAKSNLADSQSAPFIPVVSDRFLNISAVVEPENRFTIGPIRTNPARGTATVIVNLPNPGSLEADGGGPRISRDVPDVGPVSLRVSARGKKAARLRRRGRLNLRLTVTYDPTGGEPSEQTASVPLRLR